MIYWTNNKREAWAGKDSFMARHDFVYVEKREYLPVKKELIELIEDVQKDLRNRFTFSYKWIGSTHRKMITRDKKSNIGYDFDLDIYPNIEYTEYKPKQLRNIFINTINKYAHQYGYGTCENSTRVLTIKVKDRKNSKILHSCDIAICFEFQNGVCRYIHYNKKQNCFEWQKRPNPCEVEEKVKWLKAETDEGWNEVKKRYLQMKNNNTNENKKSRSLYVEAVSAVYNQYKI